MNPLEDYIEMISYDLREIRAFIEAIDSRNTTQNLKDRCEESRQSAKVEQEKLSNGQTTLKSLFSRGSKEEQA